MKYYIWFINISIYTVKRQIVCALICTNINCHIRNERFKKRKIHATCRCVCKFSDVRLHNVDLIAC